MNCLNYKIMKTLKIAFRNLLKNKVVSVINLVGLTLGVVVSLLLLAYVQQEKQADRFIADYEDIYSINNVNNGEYYIAKPMVDLLRDKMPDIPITYLDNNWAKQVFLSNNYDKKVKVNKLLDADSSFFKVFQFEPILGNTQQAFSGANKIVLTESLAAKIFGTTNPIGEKLNFTTSYQNNEMVEVVAVIKDLPQNTSWEFDAVLSMETTRKMEWYKKNADRWGTQNYISFCRLPKGLNPVQINEQLAKISQGNSIPEGYRGEIVFGIEPYSQQYFNTEDTYFLKHGNSKTLNILQLIAILILLMATINYVNLVSAQRQKRNKSVAIIKMLGSQKWGVIQLFMAESALLLISVVILFLFLSPFAVEWLNSVMATHYTTALLRSSSSILLLSGILFFTFTVTGIVPGLIFSRHEALKLIKPDIISAKSSLFRNLLPISQFAISISLIICLLVMKKQNDMMLNFNTGFQKEHIVYASTNGYIKKNGQAFINEIKALSGVAELTFADAVLTDVSQHWGLEATYKGEAKKIDFDKVGVSPNFFDFFGLKLKKGRLFEENRETDRHAFVMNESAISAYGYKDLEDVKLYGDDGRVVGVIEDFNLKSAHHSIAPLAFMCDGNNVNKVVYLKLNTTNYADFKKTMGQVEQIWNKLSPSLPLEYGFLDESWNALYNKELQFQKVLNYAGIISIIIAALGLFGLSIFVAERRTKEIGIRKINGATITEILAMLNKDFVKWVAIAFVIATPIAYYVMNKWLENFAYKTALSWWIFALAGLSALVIALLTVSWQSYRAASRNPVEALRYE